MPSSAAVVNGGAKIISYDHNYGDATLRSDTRYDLTSGTFVAQLSDDTQGWPLLGSAYIAFTTLPYNAPSITRDNGQGPTPQTGVYLQLRDNCRIPWGPPQASKYTNYAESVISGTCLVSPPPAGTTEIRYTAGKAEFWVAAVKYAEVNVTVPPVGFVLLGVHNHASDKYGDGPGPVDFLDGWFDNISYPAAASSPGAWVVFNAYANPASNPTVTVNGHVHTFTPHTSGSHSFAEAVPVPLSDLQTLNTVSVAGFAVVANVQIVTAG